MNIDPVPAPVLHDDYLYVWRIMTEAFGGALLPGEPAPAEEPVLQSEGAPDVPSHS